jgi:protein SCO1/2
MPTHHPADTSLIISSSSFQQDKLPSPNNNRRIMRFYVAIISIILLASCKQPVKQLPILGNPVITGKDTTYPTIANFSLTNQDGQTVTNKTFENKIYVADFIFLSCPTICPKMTREMYNAYLPYASDNRVAFISHTIDPEHDTIPRLKAYATNLGVSSPKWQFVTGKQDSIMNLSEHSYFSTAYPDSTSPGGFTHSGGLLLVDKNRHIRGVYNGTKPEETQRLINDIQTLLKEQF